MKDGIISGIIPPQYPYAKPIQMAAVRTNCSAFLAYAIAEAETIEGELAGMWNAATVVSFDYGYGLFQITSQPIPPNWSDPYTNARWAMENFILPAWSYWSRPAFGAAGESLVRCIAAEFNAGRGAALAGHEEHQDVGYYTTGRDYDKRVLKHYRDLLKTGHN